MKADRSEVSGMPPITHLPHLNTPHRPPQSKVNYATGSPLFTLSAWLLMQGASKWEVIRGDLCEKNSLFPVSSHRPDWHGANTKHKINH